MGYRTLRQCVTDLERAGQLVRFDAPVDAYLEAAEIQRRVYANGGPAVLMTCVRGSRFPLLCNLFGTLDRAYFLFRDTWERVKRLVELKADPTRLLRAPRRYAGAAWSARLMLPRHVRRAAVLEHRVAVSDLPQVQCWPRDGGPFITLPLVYTEDPRRPGPQHSNLGMYRIQLAGGQYRLNEEVGLHYQIHRGIGVHDSYARQQNQELAVEVWVGGTPAMILAAIMPLPEGLSELSFAGVLAGHRIPLLVRPGEPAIYAEADFRIRGRIVADRLLPEGPFGDHLGYYSLAHPFPVLRVEEVTHRSDAIWPFTVVGRPPQEDTTFGQLIHELSQPMVPTLLPGVREVHAVDDAGVHPLMLAIGSERYTPYQPITEPQELLTQAHAILGHGQMSLAKYLLIADGSQYPQLSTRDIASFFRHVLQRADWQRDLHFHTCTTIDTLDYTGTGFHRGSKLIIAAAGPPRFTLAEQLPKNVQFPAGFAQPVLFAPGILVLQGPPATHAPTEEATDLQVLCTSLENQAVTETIRWIVVVDDSRFASRSWRDFLWVTFTRSNPASDVYGVGAFHHQKHWGCRGPLVIDARRKPHHAPPLESDPEVAKRVDALAARGGPLAKYL
jgi:4-hydroxy-3-polyprenylbenzoate decarboxylase